MKKSKQDDLNNDLTNDEAVNESVADDDTVRDGNATSEFDNATDDQFDDFSQDDFADLDQFDDDGEQTDEINSEFDDDLSTEFHGADPDLPLEEMDGGTTKKSLVEFVKENWLYGSIGIVVIVVAFYLIIGLFSTPDAPAQPTQPAAFTTVPTNTQQTTSTTTTEQPAEDTTMTLPTNAAGITPPVADVVISDDQLNKLLEGMTKVVEENNKKISQEISQSTAATSNAKLSALETNVASLSNNVNKLNQTLSGLETKLSNTQSQLATLLASETATQEKLTLRAVVPGRAWLIDSKGHTISVTEGTALGVFGTVTNIDTSTNSVTTSSGYVFK